MNHDELSLHTYEEQFLREMEELKQDNDFLQNTVTGLQKNLDGYIHKYELLSQEYESALAEIRRLQQRIS